MSEFPATPEDIKVMIEALPVGGHAGEHREYKKDGIRAVFLWTGDEWQIHSISKINEVSKIIDSYKWTGIMWFHSEYNYE